MIPQEINLTDFERIFIGEVPGTFYLELIIRAVVVYLILMVSMRVMGKRMSSELSRNEMVAVVSMAAAIGVPLMNADRGILFAIVIAVVIVCYQMLIAKLSARNEKFERITQDTFTVLVADGVLNLKTMRQTRISRERLFAQLRSSEKKHLGEVSRLYLEAGGTFTLIDQPERRPGLCIIPDWDKDFLQRVKQRPDTYVCNHCGFLEGSPAARPDHSCPNCGKTEWVEAVG